MQRSATTTDLPAAGIGELLTELRAIRAAIDARPAPNCLPARLTVAQVAELQGVKEEVVLKWIDAGILKAIDVRTPGKSRPKWRITLAKLAEFDAARESRAQARPAKKSKSGESAVDPETGELKKEFLTAPKRK